MSTDVVVAVIVAASGTGGVVALYRVWVDHRKGARDATMKGFQEVIDSLQEEVQRLKEARKDDREQARRDREEDRARLSRVEQQIAVERDLKWLSIQHIRSLYAWIAHHLPGVAPPAVPDALAEHITYPASPPSAPTEETP